MVGRAGSTGRDGDGGTVLLGWVGEGQLPEEPAPRTSASVRWIAGAVGGVTVLAVAQLLIEALTVLLARQAAPYESSFGSRVHATELPQLLELTKNGGRNPVYLDELPTTLRVIAAAPVLVHAATILVAGVLVVGLVLAVTRGRGSWTSARPMLALLGPVLLAGGLLVGLGDTVAVRLVSTAVFEVPGIISVDGFRLAGPQWPWTMIAAGLVVLVLRLVFREGARLQDEVDSVV